jgi:hypothetical protein
MFSRLEIVRFDYKKTKNQFTLVYKFDNELQDQPDFCSFNEKQNFAIIASDSDALWLKIGDKSTSRELDLDEVYMFADIKCVEYYQGKFYFLANRLNEVIGQYLFWVNEDMSANVINPELNFIMKQENKFNIGDGSIDIEMIESEPLDDDGENTKTE